mmetsp:Transcript_6392/g.12468  ORF Transcript_6392/g.12468 Transcript_6392/m.12468 type:complete len:609 (-) Transcript_6392:49-1875(-)
MYMCNNTYGNQSERNKNTSNNVADGLFLQPITLDLTEDQNQSSSETGPSRTSSASCDSNIALNIVEDNDAMKLGLDTSTSVDMVIDSNCDPNNSDPRSDPNQTSPPIAPCNAVEDLLSNDLMRLSVSDRTSIFEELHGVRSLAIEENDDENHRDRVSKALIDLDQTLEHRIPAHQKTAFRKAQSLQHTKGTYVNDLTFRLKFLRCKLFDVNAAACLLVNYVELVRELYGDVCLSRPIRLDDVQKTKEERAAFRFGFIQLLPFGDRAGRRIIIINTNALLYSTYIRVKICLYIWTVVSNDVTTQQKGTILICWDGRNDMTLPNRSEQQLVRKLFSAIPLRICGIHFCFSDSPFYRMARAIFALAVGGVEHRNRSRFHVEEEIELKYQVGTFGIPVSQIPITETGNVKTGNFYKWIAMRKIVEEKEALEAASREQRLNLLKMHPGSQTQSENWLMQMRTQIHAQFQPVKYIIHNDTNTNIVGNLPSTTSFVEYPGLNDVAFRKGMSLMHHPGNDYFHGLIQSKILEHNRSSQTEKARIAWWVVDEVRKRKGRFLSWHQQGWWALLEDESKIRLKVAVFFREWKKYLKAGQNRQSMTTSSKTAYSFQRAHD